MKKIMKYLPVLCIAILMCVMLPADNVEAAPKLSKKYVYLTKGSSKSLKVKNASGAKCRWSSSNKSVAAVSKKGVVKAKNTGSATITCKVSGKSLKCNVKVIAKDSTGYKPKHFTWKKDGTEGYAMKYFAAGKYVRSDGKAVLYINDWDTGESFNFELYAYDGSSWSKHLYLPDTEVEQYAFGSIDMFNAKVAYYDTFFHMSMKDNGKHAITVKLDASTEGSCPNPKGTYYLVKAK